MEDPKPPTVGRDESLPAAALGHAIKVIRTGLGLDRKDLARQAGLSYSYLAEIENGRKPASAAAQQALARALGLSLSELLAAAEEWAVRLRGAELEAPGWVGDELDVPVAMQRASSPSRSGGARARQERWFRASALRSWSSSSGARAPVLPAAAPAEDEADAFEEELALLRKLLATLSPDDRERVLDLARRLART